MIVDGRSGGVMGHLEDRADESARKRRVIVLRRFAGEPLEIVALDPPAAEPTLEGPRGCRITSRMERDTQVYQVELPAGYAVRPVDWRRFATDPDELGRRLETCVRDNLPETTVEAWTEATRAWAVARLTLALEDLRSMITPHEVTCGLDSHPELRQVYIEFSDVRGQVRSCVVRLETVDTADDDPG